MTSFVNVQEFRINTAWVYTQVERHIFFYQTESLNAGFLLNVGKPKFEKKFVADTAEKRIHPAICNQDQKYIWLTGGKFSRTVTRYEIQTDNWQTMPPLTDTRFDHASCCLSSIWIYVICGSVTQFEKTDTIERLNTGDLQAGWQQVTVLCQNS